MAGPIENQLINAIFQIDLVKKALPPGEAKTLLNIAIVAASDALEALVPSRVSNGRAFIDNDL